MRFILSVVIICCLISVSSATESEQEDWKNYKPEAGDNAFLFQTGTNLRIGSYYGLVFAGRHHSSNTHALELRVGFDGNLDDDETKYSTFNDSLEVRVYTGNDYSWITRFSVVYLKYFDRQSNLLPFWGIGPTFQYGYSFSEQNDDSYARNSVSNVIDIGLISDIGFEWFILPEISLIATYKMKFVHRWSSYKQERWDDDGVERQTRKSRGFEFGYERTDLGVALYF